MKNIAIIGAGPAGIEAASILAKQHKITLFEKEETPLGNIRNKALLFPDFSRADELANQLMAKLQQPQIELRTSTTITHIQQNDNRWQLTDQSGVTTVFDQVLITTGYEIYDAHRKEELGYGIYNGIITSIDLEAKIKTDKLVNTIGDPPKRVVFLQCVGSRDVKSGNHYCSKVCCVTAVKQAIEVKKMSPTTDVYIFYMDLRMWGQGFEEMYRTAQEQYGINFVRGRISEAASTYDGKIQLKAEDTLMGLPLDLNADLFVLMVGMCPSEGTRTLSTELQLSDPYGFILSQDEHLNDNLTDRKGLFVAGSCKRPMSVNDTIQDARAAALALL